MKTMNDPIFGEVVYDYSWSGQRDIPGLGKLSVIAQAYPGEAISDKQRAAFQQFLAEPTAHLSSATAALIAYAEKVYPGTDVSTLHPTGILFCQNGVWGFLYPSPVGEDDGLSVRFENGQVIADTDDSLF